MTRLGGKNQATYINDQTGEHLQTSSHQYHGNSLDNASFVIDRGVRSIAGERRIESDLDFNGFGNEQAATAGQAKFMTWQEITAALVVPNWFKLSMI